MFSWSNLFIGLTMTVIGILGVKYTFQIVNTTGQQDWLEHYTGPGSTYAIFKIMFLLLAVAGLVFASGFGPNLVELMFSPLKGLFVHN